MLHRSHLQVTDNTDEQCAECKYFFCKTYKQDKNDGGCTLHDDLVRSDFTCDDFSSSNGQQEAA